MAKYEVTHSCGHTETLQLYGRHKDRERRIQWLETSGLCSRCYLARREQQREDGNAAAELWAANAGLAPLEGTDRQVAWAETIRREKLTELVNLSQLTDQGESASAGRFGDGIRPLLRAVSDAPLDPEPREQLAAYLDAHDQRLAAQTRAAAWVLAQRSARWWIDERGKGLTQLIRERVEEPERIAHEDAERRERLEAEAAKERAAKERMAKLWGEKDAIAAKVREFLGDLASEIHVWSDHSGTERRVYIGHGFNKNCVTYYHTGNRRQRPGLIVWSEHAKAAVGGRVEEFRAFLAEVAERWKALRLGVLASGGAA